MRKVAVSIVRFIAMELGLEAQKFSDTYKERTYDVRMNCYPPCPERVIGVNPHTNISGITLLVECGITRAWTADFGLILNLSMVQLL